LVRIVDGSNELIRVRLADGAEQALTSTPEREETWPYWSSVAKRLVFQVSRGGSDSDLMLWSPEAGETPLVETPRREERWPAWSPRRAALVYAFRGGHPAAGASGASRRAAGRATSSSGRASRPTEAGSWPSGAGHRAEDRTSGWSRPAPALARSPAIGPGST
jgi:hypothetical protein